MAIIREFSTSALLFLPVWWDEGPAVGWMVSPLYFPHRLLTMLERLAHEG